MDKTGECPLQVPEGQNVYQTPCPIVHALNLIDGKWKLPVLWRLHEAGTLRYNALKRGVPGVTNTMLAKCLRELEADGLVERREDGGYPLKVEYTLTGQGRGLIPVARALYAWGREHLDQEGKRNGGRG